MNDMMGYMYFSLHFDLFSDPKMLRFNKLFACFDVKMFADFFVMKIMTDIPDWHRQIPHTPKGVWWISRLSIRGRW